MHFVFNNFDKSIYNFFPLGSNNNSIYDKVCAFLFSMTPLVQHYYGLYENAGFTFYLLILPMMFIRLLSNGGKLHVKQVSPVIPLIVFELYCIASRIGSISRVLYSVFLILLLLMIYNGCLNIRYVFKYAVWIGSIATCLIIIQYISYYIFHHVINFEPHSWLLPENGRWVVNVVYSESRLYRPSGFFLEPSHIFLYCLPLIALCLLLPDINLWRKQVAFFLSVGVLLSTSGMGVFVVLGLWILYSVTKGHAEERILSILKKVMNIRGIIIVFLFVVVLILSYRNIPFFQRSLMRIFTDDVTVNAIAGRTRRASTYVRNITGKTMFFGSASAKESTDFSASGFFATYMRWGIIGLVLSYAYYFEGLLKLKNAYYWFSFLLIFLSLFTAHTHGTFYMIYYSSILANGYVTLNNANKKTYKEKRLDKYKSFTYH